MAYEEASAATGRVRIVAWFHLYPLYGYGIGVLRPVRCSGFEMRFFRVFFVFFSLKMSEFVTECCVRSFV
jgi:hypothetical protein